MNNENKKPEDTPCCFDCDPRYVHKNIRCIDCECHKRTSEQVWQECEDCQRKPGSPTLCNACLISRAKFYSSEAVRKIEPLPDFENLSKDKIDSSKDMKDMLHVIFYLQHNLWNKVNEIIKHLNNEQRK